MQLVEVRCCCQPQKLLGYLPMYGAVRAGARATWPLNPVHVVSFDDATYLTERLTLEIRLWSWCPCADFGPAEIGLAFYSEETPLSTLRRVPGFVEAP